MIVSRPLRPAAALIVIGFGVVPLWAGNPSITGRVLDRFGNPVSGALVKVGSEELGLKFVVVTQAKGQYRTPDLLPGKYKIQAFDGSHQTALSGAVDIRAGLQPSIDLTLNIPLELPPRLKRMKDEDYAKLMPEGNGRTLVASRCTTCHTLQWVLSARKTAEKWRETVARMRDNLQGRRKPLNDISSEADLIQLDNMADYLGKYFGPDNPADPRVVEQSLLRAGGLSHPNRNLPAAPMKSAYVAMEFSLPPDSAPHDIAVDAEGKAWISEANTGILGRFDPTLLTYTRLTPPAGKSSKLRANSVAVDPRGCVWFVDDGPNARLVRFDSSAKDFKTYQLPEYRYPTQPGSTGARLVTLRFLDGNVWATGLAANWLLKLDPRTGNVSEYPVPKGTSPYGLAIGGDQTVWYSAEVANLVGKMEPTSGRITYYKAPKARSELRGMSSDSKGNLWVAATDSGALLSVDYKDGAFTEFMPPTADSGPYSVDASSKQPFIWFSEIFVDRIARFDPRNKSFVEFPLPSADEDLRRIEVDPGNPNRVWWAGNKSDRIGYIEVLE
jgi:virginiamycin B lyase